jgi:hypothetical protein
MIVSSRLLVPYKIDAKRGDHFLQAAVTGQFRTVSGFLLGLGGDRK